MVNSQSIIAEVVPARERGKYMGVMGGVFALSSVVGPLIGGWITEGPGWRYAFWMSVALGVIALAGVVSAVLYLRRRQWLDALLVVVPGEVAVSALGALSVSVGAPPLAAVIAVASAAALSAVSAPPCPPPPSRLRP